MKTKNKKKRIAPAFKSFYPVLIMILCLFMGVGYAAVNSVSLTIAGDIIAMELDDVVVTDISYKESSYATLDSSSVSVVNKTVLNSNIALSSTNSNSYITYTVTVLNTNTYDCFYNGAVFDSGFYDNQNIIFELSDNMIEGMFLKAGESLSFDIKFKYKDGVTPNSSINKLNAYINVDFPAVAVLQNTDSDGKDTTKFRTYKESIKNISFEDKISEPSNVVDSWDIGVSQTGNVMAYLVANEDDSSYYDLYIQSDTQLYANKDMCSWFRGLTSVEKINGFELLNTSNTTNMQHMFTHLGKYSSSITLDVSSFDTSKVTNMRSMFNNVGSESPSVSIILGNMDTSGVTTMEDMFYRTGYLDQLFTLDVSKLDTSNVTNMDSMFKETGFNSTKLKLDVSNFNTSKVTTMAYMFYQTGYKSTVFLLDLKNFDTSQVLDMQFMFHSVGYQNLDFTLDVSSFNTSNVTNMYSMFNQTGRGSKVFILDLSNFDTSKVTNMHSMFYETGYSSPIFTLDISSFDTSNVTDMSRTFYYTGYNNTTFTLDVSHFNTSKVKTMHRMFQRAGYHSTEFTLDVSGFDTSNVEDMSYMFSNTGYDSTKFNLDLSHFDTSKVTDMSSFLYNVGKSSSLLNTSITIVNPQNTIYETMFFGAATKTGAKIVVNYNDETSDLVDKMIATKSETSNVVKGTLVS